MSTDNYFISDSDDIGVEYFTALGEIVTKFNLLEQLVLHLISKLVVISYDDLECLIGGDYFLEVIGKLKKVVHTKTKNVSAIGAVNGFCEELAAVNTERNTFLHSIYMRDGDEIWRGKMLRRVRGHQIKEGVPVTLTELKACIGRINTLINKTTPTIAVISLIIQSEEPGSPPSEIGEPQAY